MATPNGYIIPPDPSQVCQMHGYQYLPAAGIYSPHMFSDEGFVSVDQSPYISEFVPDQGYHRQPPNYEEMEAHTKAKFARLYEGERKEIKEVLQDSITHKSKKKSKDSDSCDSGVSESEEGTQQTQGDQTSQQNGETETNDPKDINKNKSLKKSNEKLQNEERGETIKTKKDTKKKNKSPKEKKAKKALIEILEPDFSSFSGTTLRFESKQDKEVPRKQNLNTKLIKNRKKKNAEAQSDDDTATPPNASKKKNKVNSEHNAAFDTTQENDLNATDQAEDSSQEKTDFRSQEIKITKNDKEPSEGKEKQELISSKRSKRNRKKSKGSKLEKETKNGDVQTKTENSLSTASECLFLNKNFNKLPDEDRLSLESENATVSEEWLSQESENVTMSDDILSQDSEILISEVVCLNPENENFSEKDESSSQKSENDTASTDNTEKCSEQKEQVETVEATSKMLMLEAEPTATSYEDVSFSKNMEPPTYTNSNKVEPFSQEEATENSNSLSLVQIPSSSALLVSDEYTNLNSNSTLSSASETCSQSREKDSPTLEEEDCCSSALEQNELSQSFKDLGVTEAVKRWIREVTPEKAFAISQETRSLILSSVVNCHDDEEDDDDDQSLDTSEESDDVEYFEEQESKNVLGNPSVASPSEGAGSERVAASTLSKDSIVTLYHDGTLPQRFNEERFRLSSSQDVLDEYDGESVISCLSRGRLYSSSSCSSFPLAHPHLEDATHIEDDPRVYDPNVYSKYYQLGVDVRPTPSCSISTRESTLSPLPLGSESEDADPNKDDPPTPTAPKCMSLSTELYKSQKFGTNMSHTSPSLCEDPLPLPHCGFQGPFLGKEVHHEGQEAEEAEEASACDKNIHFQQHVPSSSVTSSGIGSSLASTPNVSPAHQPQPPSLDQTTKRPKLEPYPLKNLSAAEGPMPCKAVCCSVM